jgi:hypothetical protein
MLRIRDVYPGSKRFRIPDQDPHQRILVFLTQKIVSTQALGNLIRDVYPGSRSWFFTHPGSSVQKSTGSATPEWRADKPVVKCIWLKFFFLARHAAKTNKLVIPGHEFGKLFILTVLLMRALYLEVKRSIFPEPVLLNVYGAQESIPRNEFRQPM